MKHHTNKVILSIAAAFTVTAAATAQSGCAGDISGDGQVNGVDLSIVLTSWGVCQASPTISGVYPPVGPVAGGTPIAIVGVDLGRTASVTIDGVIAPQFSAVSGTTVTAVTPPGSAGARAIVLRDAQGQQLAAATFNYAITELPWATVLEQYPNPAVVTSLAVRNRIIDAGLPWRVRHNGTGIEMVLVPPGVFEMGCTQGSNSYGCGEAELPVHQVTLTSAFYIGRYEVTQAQWEAKVGSNNAFFQGRPDSPSRPMEQISWDHLNIYFLSQTDLRLPTEAEWEFAYRAGTTTAFHGFAGHPLGTNDDALITNICWFEGNSGGETRAVGSKAGNGFGVHDMAGNVWEWVGDRYGGFNAEPEINPTGAAKGEARVIRGGYWGDSSQGPRASSRGAFMPDGRAPAIGFRVARNP